MAEVVQYLLGDYTHALAKTPIQFWRTHVNVVPSARHAKQHRARLLRDRGDRRTYRRVPKHPRDTTRTFRQLPITTKSSAIARRCGPTCITVLQRLARAQRIQKTARRCTVFLYADFAQYAFPLSLSVRAASPRPTQPRICRVEEVLHARRHWRFYCLAPRSADG